MSKHTWKAFLGLTLVPTMAHAQPVDIPDRELEVSIRIALGIPARAIERGDLEKLTRLRVSGFTGRLRSLRGLEHAVNLQEVRLSGQAVTDLTPLSQASSLTSLNLRGNDLKSTVNIGLESLTSLTEIDLSGNHLDRFSLPPDLSKISTLDLEGNQLNELQLPENATSIRRLRLDGNRLNPQSIAGLTHVPNLDHLDLSSNGLDEVTLPASLRKLRSLTLDGNLLQSVSLPTDPSELSSLSLANNRLTDLDAIVGLERVKGLRKLDLSKNALSSFALPAALQSVGQLSLLDNPLETVDLNRLRASPSQTILIPSHIIGGLTPPLSKLKEAGIHVQMERHVIFDIWRSIKGTVHLDIVPGPRFVEIHRTADMIHWERIAWFRGDNGCSGPCFPWIEFVDEAAIEWPKAIYRLIDNPESPSGLSNDDRPPGGP